MDWRLNKLIITNFKFFCKEFILPVDCNNLLIYGENGSGKSSIYWSLYTILQSCLKPNAEVASKYFDSEHSENLRNRFSDDKYSGIRVEFKHTDGRAKTFENSSQTTNTIGTTDNFMRLTTAATGFMNYKFLSALFEFKNSEQNDVFPIFEKEIFPFLQFTRDHQLIGDDNFKQSITAEGWWRYIVRCHSDVNILKHSPSKPASILENTHEYKAFLSLLSDFDSELQNRLREIIHRVNEKLIKVFNLPIALEYHYEDVGFNKIKPGTTKSKDGKIHKPRIILVAKLNHKVIKDARAIHHPKSFFNEAKLTVVALALRLSVYEMMLSNTPDCAEMLIVDDLLVSLDMCNRMKVIDVLLDYEKRNKQLIVLTHDRALFHLIKSKIENNQFWRSFELFSKYEGYINDEIPTPVLIKNDNYIEQAHKHIKRFDFPAAANSLRKACEYYLKSIIPDKFQYSGNDEGAHQSLTLHGLISALKKFDEYYQIDIPFVNLDTYRERILNPFSHDDLNTPLYRGELMALLADVEKLSKFKKFDIIPLQDIGKKSYHLEMQTEKGKLEADLILKERFTMVLFDGRIYYSNPDILVTYCNLRSWNNRQGPLRRFVRDMCGRAKIDPANGYHYIYNLQTSKNIYEIANSIKLSHITNNTSVIF